MADWILDGPNRIIKEPPGAGDTVWLFERDIYSAWKRWVTDSDGSKFPNAFIPEGGTPIGLTGRFTGSTLVLTNGWKLQGADHDHQVTIIGNADSDDGVMTISNPNFNVNFFSQIAAGAQGISTGGMTPEQEAKIDHLIHLYEADEIKQGNQLRRLQRGTSVDLHPPKTITGSQAPDGGIVEP